MNDAVNLALWDNECGKTYLSTISKKRGKGALSIFHSLFDIKSQYLLESPFATITKTSILGNWFPYIFFATDQTIYSSKDLEKMIYQVLGCLEVNNILDVFQSGFRALHN